jgi:hypothetical protein
MSCLARLGFQTCALNIVSFGAVVIDCLPLFARLMRSEQVVKQLEQVEGGL